jgi:type I restriction enzyme S subunit
MHVRPGYKETEIGVIPENWELRPLLLTVRIANGQVDPRIEPYREMILVAPDHIESGTGRLLSRQTASDQRAISGKYAFDRGDIVYSKIRPYLRKAVLAEFDGLCSADMYPLKPAVDVSGGFILSVLLGHRFTKYAESVSVRSGMPKINRVELADFVVALPPSAEQGAIARTLSDVDALLVGLDRLIAKKRDLKEGAMQQLLTGQTRLAGFGPTKRFKQFDYGVIPEDWEVKPFWKVSSMNGRIGWQGLKQEEFTQRPDDPFLITGMNFKDGRIRWAEVYHIPTKRYLEAQEIQLRVGDVLMTKDGTIGKLLFVDQIPYPGKASLNSHLLVFRPLQNHYDPKFLFYQLGSPQFARHVDLHKSGSTFFGLTQAATGTYPMVLPSLPEQTAIATTLSDMDAEISALEARHNKTRDLKQAIMQELLTGKTRLVPAGPANA